MVFVQDNQSMSTKGVLRGPHFRKKYPKGKLEWVIKGLVLDVAAELRSGSEIRTMVRYGAGRIKQEIALYLRGFCKWFLSAI